MHPLAPKLPNKVVAEFDEFYKPKTWRERWKLFLGFNLKIHVKVVVDRRNTRIQERVEVSLTEHTNAVGQLQEHIESGEV